MRNLYRIIENEIKEKGIETITLDIFDTVLLRKIWPEDMQFLKVSRKWIPELREVFSNNIQEYELYSLRMYTRKELLNINYTYDTDREKEYDVNLKTSLIKLFLINYPRIENAIYSYIDTLLLVILT
mgnify:CR=1 FL=1